VCGLVFVPRNYHLSAAAEKARYDLHDNSTENSGYVNFLNQYISTTLSFMDGGGRGLDFGSGPGPVLSGLLSYRGFVMSIFDPIYAHDESVFSEQYDLITMVEVLEHLKDPVYEIRRLLDCLAPGGTLSIMTKMLPRNQGDFTAWSYKNDPTHICFYSASAIEWLSAHLNTRVIYPSQDMVLMRRAIMI